VKLVSLTLNNIKSYCRETINFHNGVNFISGINGTGKSTIIEAIGYVLFDANPFSSMKQFIREGEKKGEISLVFEGRDERLYRVVRRLRSPSGSSWAVYDIESGGELNELHGNQDVKIWLAENLGVTFGLEPSLLYEDVIGVSQGRFTTPFLEKGERRKKLFNTILQLDSYREVFDKTASMNATLGEKIALKERKREGMMVRIEDLPQCKEQLQEKEKEIEILKASIKALSAELKGIEDEIAFQEKYKLETEKGEKNLEGIIIRLKGLAEQKERVKKDIKLANICCEKVEASFQGYKEYIMLQKEQEELEKRRKAKELLKIKQQKLLQEIVALKAELKSETENREKLLRERQEEIDRLRIEGEKLLKENVYAEEKRVLGQTAKQLLEEQVNNWKTIAEIRQVAKESITEANYLKNDTKKVEAEINILKEELVKWEETEKMALSVVAFEKEESTIKEELNILKGKIRALQENKSVAKDGLCPFLQMPCKNVEGDLQQYFINEINKFTPDLNNYQVKEQAVRIKLKDARLAVTKLGVLQSKMKQLQTLELRKQDILDELQNNREIILNKLQPHVIEKLTQTLLDGVDDMQNIVNQELKNGVEVETDESVSKNIIDIVKEYEILYNEFGDIVILLQKVDMIEDIGNKFINNKQARISKYLEEWTGKGTGISSKLDYQRERFRRTRDELVKLKEDKKLERKEIEANEKSQSLLQIDKEINEFGDMESCWENNVEKMKEKKHFYVQYMQNKEGAEKKEQLIVEHKRISEDEIRKRQEQESLEASLVELKGKYNLECLLELKNKRELLITEKVNKEKDGTFCIQEITKLAGMVEKKEKIRREVIILNKEVSKGKKGQKLLQILRSVLKNSGEEMADVYRQYLGREANSIYQQISGENVNLLWSNDYEIKIIDNQEGKERERVFTQLSGGEKMTAALAVRLALLRQFSGFGIGIFDEPTSNLDEQRRNNLASIIPKITKDLRQVFVISHDDTFDAITENIIMLKKEKGVGTKVV